jgi:hypothetical protein
MLHRLARYKSHFPQTRGNPVDPVDADDLALLARLKLVKGGHDQQVPY